MRRHDANDKGLDSEFAFMHVDDDFNAFEWEQMEKDIDRAWYDADEDSNIRYGGESDPFTDFM
jgi:hypothetical protein